MFHEKFLIAPLLFLRMMAQSQYIHLKFSNMCLIQHENKEL